MNKHDLMAILFMLTYLVIFGFLVYNRFHSLGMYGDTAYVIYAIAHPSLKNLVLYHFFILLGIFKPLMDVLGCVNFILVLWLIETASIAFAGFMLYLIGRDVASSSLGLVLQLLFYVSPLVHGLNLFGIHVEGLGISVLSIGLYFLLVKDRPLLGYLISALSLGFKETFAFPILGAFLWRLVNKKCRKWEVALSVLGIIVILSTPFLLSKLEGLIRTRYITSFELFYKELFYDVYLKLFLFFIFFLNAPLAFISPTNLVLALPDLFNIFWTAAIKHSFKFIIGFQYHAVPLYMLLVASAFAIRRLNCKPERVAKGLILVLTLILVIDVWVSPVGVFPVLKGIYPLKVVTYRPPFSEDAKCFDCAVNLLKSFVKFKDEYLYNKTNLIIMAPDQLSAFFACYGKPRGMGSFVFIAEKELMNKLDSCEGLKALRAGGIKRSDVFVNLPGLTRSLDLNLTLVEKVCKHFELVPTGGYICIPDSEAVDRMISKICGNVTNGIKAYFFTTLDGEVKYEATYRNPFIDWWIFSFRAPPYMIREFEPWLPPYLGRSWADILWHYPSSLARKLFGRGPDNLGLRFYAVMTAKILIPLSAKYEFHLFSDDGSILFLNNRTLVDCWGPGICDKRVSVYLKEGYYNITILYANYKGGSALKLFWKPPYACNEEPVPSSYLLPRDVKPYGASLRVNDTWYNAFGLFNRREGKVVACSKFFAPRDGEYVFIVRGNVTFQIDGKTGTQQYLRRGEHTLWVRGAGAFEVYLSLNGRRVPLVYPLVKACWSVGNTTVLFSK